MGNSCVNVMLQVVFRGTGLLASVLELPRIDGSWAKKGVLTKCIDDSMWFHCVSNRSTSLRWRWRAKGARVLSPESWTNWEVRSLLKLHNLNYSSKYFTSFFGFSCQQVMHQLTQPVGPDFLLFNSRLVLWLVNDHWVLCDWNHKSLIQR